MEWTPEQYAQLKKDIRSQPGFAATQGSVPSGTEWASLPGVIVEAVDWEAISRQSLFDLSEMVSAGAAPVRSFFVACMAWGYGNSGRGRWRTRQMLATSNADRKLLDVFEIARSEGGLEGYRAMSSRSRLDWLGPVFGTKFLHFAAYEAAKESRPLVLDAFVGGALGRRGVRIGHGRWRVDNTRRYFGYATYLDLAATLSNEVLIEPADVEFRLFSIGKTLQKTLQKDLPSV